MGFDISYPQCPDSFPEQTFSFAIIGVNGGKAFLPNTCLFNQYHWAKKAKADISLYMNLNFPSGDTSSYVTVGFLGICLKSDLTCQAYNYGYNAAKDAYHYASSQFATSPIWWIDIETANTWSDNLVLNNHVLQGAIDFLNAEYIQVGVYSTKREWQIVMGTDFIPSQHFIDPVPNWVGTGLGYIDLQRCLEPFIPNSSVWIIQYSHQGYDANYLCG